MTVTVAILIALSVGCPASIIAYDHICRVQDWLRARRDPMTKVRQDPLYASIEAQLSECRAKHSRGARHLKAKLRSRMNELLGGKAA